MLRGLAYAMLLAFVGGLLPGPDTEAVVEKALLEKGALNGVEFLTTIGNDAACSIALRVSPLK